MKSKKGITLIALIITIIVMLILVGVTINVIIQGGLFGQAQDAVRKQEEQTIYEQMLSMIVWNQDGSINVKATVDAIENSGIITVTSKEPSEITDNTTSVTITVTGKQGEYKYKITEDQITIEDGNGGGTDLLAELRAELIGKNLMPGQDNSATSSIDNMPGGLPSFTFKNSQIIFNSFDEETTYINISYKGEKFSIIYNEEASITNVIEYEEPMQDDDGIFRISILDEINKKVEITKFGENGEAWLAENNGTLTIPSTITYNSETYFVSQIGKEAFYSNDNITSLIFNGNNLTRIGTEAFRRCESLVGTLTIPVSVVSIGGGAFRETEITGLTLSGNNLTIIGDDAFDNCTSLAGTLTIPASVESIGSSAFINTGITTLVFGNDSSLTTIGYQAFTGCRSLTGTLTIPASVESVGSNAFRDTGITTLVFSNDSSLTTIGDAAFEGCTSLTGALTIPSSVESIGGSAFYDTNLTSITVSHSVTGSPWGAYGAQIISSD